MKSMDLGCGVGSGRNSEDVFYVSATLRKEQIYINMCILEWHTSAFKNMTKTIKQTNKQTNNNNKIKKTLDKQHDVSPLVSFQ